MAHDKKSTWNRQIWHLQKWCLTKMAHLVKKCPKVTLFAKDWAEWFLKGKKNLHRFLKGHFKFVVWFILWSCDFKVGFFPLQNDTPGTLLCLMIVGIGYISRMLVVLQKTNIVVVRCHLRWVPFLVGGTFDKWNALFEILWQWVP